MQLLPNGPSACEWLRQPSVFMYMEGQPASTEQSETHITSTNLSPSKENRETRVALNRLLILILGLPSQQVSNNHGLQEGIIVILPKALALSMMPSRRRENNLSTLHTVLVMQNLRRTGVGGYIFICYFFSIQIWVKMTLDWVVTVPGKGDSILLQGHYYSSAVYCRDIDAYSIKSLSQPYSCRYFAFKI